MPLPNTKKILVTRLEDLAKGLGSSTQAVYLKAEKTCKGHVVKEDFLEKTASISKRVAAAVDYLTSVTTDKLLSTKDSSVQID